MIAASCLIKGKTLLRKVKQQREWLIKNRKSYRNEEWATTELRNIEYALSSISSSKKMKEYLRDKEPVIRLLIPANKKKYHEELSDLILND